jgi:2-hydroxy-3-keto-5-methylthiopentenyl-1-phosphate phosphatase
VSVRRGGGVPVPPLRPGEPPLAFLVDYDGTIARTDVTDAILAGFVAGDWEAEAAAYDAGLLGSRAQMAGEIERITADEGVLLAAAAAQPHDPTFRAFVERARAAAIPVEVVSDGFGFFIRPALRMLGAGWVPVVTAGTRFGPGGATIAFPNGNPDCLVCGTCKRDRVRAHQAAGRAVVFVGDGASDRYAAGYADVVFAKRGLVAICVENGWAFRGWTDFAEIDGWLEARLAEFAADPAALPRPRPRRPFCGAEVWGPGRWDPAPPARD